MNLPVELQRYRATLTLIQRGDFDSAAKQLRQLRRSSKGEVQILRWLLSARIALKEGRNDFHLPPLSMENGSLEIRAEYNFVSGLTCFYREEWPIGIRSFEKAAEDYRAIGNSSRMLLCRYNVHIGKINSGILQSETIQIEDLREMQAEALRLQDRKMLGLIHRQKSYLLINGGRSSAALEEAEKAVAELEGIGSKSDHDLARLAAADAALDCGLDFKARAHFEQVLGAVDRRAELAFDFLGWRLSKSGNPFSLEKYSYCCPHFSRRARSLQFEDTEGSVGKSEEAEVLTFDRTSGVLKTQSTPGVVLLSKSLEARLLVLLARGAQRKDALIEKLWPEHAPTALLDNRLHRLISRLNRRLNGGIRFDGQGYRVQRPILLK